MQYVWIDHCFSPLLPNKVSVPKGSNLGPLFFLLHYNNFLFSFNCDIDAYADDSTMSYSDFDVKAINEQLTRNCKEVSDWMKQNKLKLNADKTHGLLVGTSARVNQVNEPLKVGMEGVEVSVSKSMSEKLLGIHVEYNLKWHKPFAELKRKLKYRLAGLSRLRLIVCSLSYS